MMCSNQCLKYAFTQFPALNDGSDWLRRDSQSGLFEFRPLHEQNVTDITTPNLLNVAIWKYYLILILNSHDVTISCDRFPCLETCFPNSVSDSIILGDPWDCFLRVRAGQFGLGVEFLEALSTPFVEFQIRRC